MLVFDVETLGTTADSVILSAGIVHIADGEKPSYDDLLRKSLFVKFDVEEQIKQLHRKVDPNTVEWWQRQHHSIRDYSCRPSPNDLSAKAGLDVIKSYVRDHHKDIIWTRGSLDQFIIDHLAKQIGEELIMPYNQYRDVRTAVDIFTGSTNGYCTVDYPGFNSYDVVKHNPVHDVCYDAMMLLYGK